MSPSPAGRAATHRGHEHRGSTSRGCKVPRVLGGQLPGTAPHQAQLAAPCRQPGPARQATSRSTTLNCVSRGQNAAYLQPRGGGEALPTFADGSVGASFPLPASSGAQRTNLHLDPTARPLQPPREARGKSCPGRDTAAPGLEHGHSLQRCRSAAAVLPL